MQKIAVICKSERILKLGNKNLTKLAKKLAKNWLKLSQSAKFLTTK
ncbi:hypothetical protein VL20_3571 [Microcystis panniformis FACHB-1757]|uniref:Uncharacterized protein n=1 Tax=Microcystis panniformis FACHB-1757 TaxID=1638788 RepID=A0A0K1S351_9CHRO|nr:hypothetical protein VL20_3571 [Microcystis panniformis FACHB-1757]